MRHTGDACPVPNNSATCISILCSIDLYTIPRLVGPSFHLSHVSLLIWYCFPVSSGYMVKSIEMETPGILR